MNAGMPELGPFAGKGPAHRRLLGWLERHADGALATTVAQRSPAGPWAIKVHAPGQVERLGALLVAEPWVEAVVTRPQHLYVRITTSALCSWLLETDAAEPMAAGREGAGRVVHVRCVEAAERPLHSLQTLRVEAVARSVARLLASRGFHVSLEQASALEATAGATPADHLLLVGEASAPPDGVRDDCVTWIPVGEIDVCHGPLRARAGGSVSVDDMVEEVQERLPAQLAARLNDEPATFAEMVVALLLLATPRTRRIRLDSLLLERETSLLARLSDVREQCRLDAQAVEAAGERRWSDLVRPVAGEVDLLATVAARAASALEPALIARSLRSLADAAFAALASGELPAPEPLRAPICEAIETAFALAGLSPAALPTCG